MSRSPPESFPELHLVGLEELRSLDRFTLERRARACVSPVYLGGNRALCRILGRLKFFLDTRDEGFGAHVLLDGFWEGWLTTFIAHRLKPGMSFVDIGANFGYYTLLAGDLVGPSGHVAAIEPNPAAVTLLTKSVALNGFNGWTKIHRVAAGEGTTKAARLVVPLTEPKNAYLTDASTSAVGEVVSVPCTSADHLLQSLERVDFIKVVAEGSEEAIVRGLRQTIERHRPDMIIEFNPRRCLNPRETLSTLLEHYGKIATLETDGQLHTASPETLLSPGRNEDWLLFLTRSE
ncbi:MAG: FkbM family methyltransferase [Hyphomonadaceae bacterium]